MSASGVFCSKCGSQNEPDAAFCSSCGARLAAAPPPPPPPSVVPAAPSPTYQAPAKGSNLPLFAAIGAVLILLLVVLVEGVLILLPRGAAEEAGATLRVLQGEVFVQRGGSGDWTEVAGDLVVEAGDRIRVADASHAVLTFLEDTTTELGALSELTLKELQTARGQPVVIRVSLELGEIWNRIGVVPPDSLHEITSVAATVTCFGSEYGMAVNEVGTTWLTGREGEIDVSAAGQTVQLRPGDTLLVELGSVPVSYRDIAVAPTPPGMEPSETVTYTFNLGFADLPTFVNRPLPTGTAAPVPPTATRVPPRPTATATRRPAPTATPRECPLPGNCPVYTITEPHTSTPNRIFRMWWEKTGGGYKPYGWEFALEFSSDGASWLRVPVPLNPPSEVRGSRVFADLRAPQGEGAYQWRVCIVNGANPRGPSCCCGPSHQVINGRGAPATPGGC
jgi:hypothetical protein